MRLVFQFHLNFSNYQLYTGYLICTKPLIVVDLYIAASNKCTTKPLSGFIDHCLSAVVTHFINGIFRNTGINCFNNSQQVINTLQGINASVKAKHFDSYDFSTLYTSIPHVSLKHNLHELIDEAYKAREPCIWQ